MDYTGDEEGYRAIPDFLKGFTEALSEEAAAHYSFAFKPEIKNEGFKTASQVNYVARCGQFKPEEYTGALKVLKVIMNYDYLWQNLRVKGGAYGCMSSFSPTGEGCLVSYRDPNLEATNQVYEKIPEYVSQFTVDERDMTKYVIGTISDADTPLTPSQRGSRDFTAYITGLTEAMVQKERDEILDVSQEDIQALKPVLEAILGTGALCVIGNEGKIEEDAGLFGQVSSLYH